MSYANTQPMPGADKIGVDYVNERLGYFISRLEFLHDRSRSIADRMFGPEDKPLAADRGSAPIPQLVATTTAGCLTDIQQKLDSIDYQLSRLLS